MSSTSQGAKIFSDGFYGDDIEVTRVTRKRHEVSFVEGDQDEIGMNGKEERMKGEAN